MNVLIRNNFDKRQFMCLFIIYRVEYSRISYADQNTKNKDILLRNN